VRRLVRVLPAFLLLFASTVAAFPAGEAVRHVPELALAASLPSDPSPSALGDYRDQIQSALRQLRERREAGAPDAAATLRRVGPVLMLDGSQTSPDLTGVISSLEAQPPDVAGGEAGLGALLAEIDRSGSLSRYTTTDGHDRLQRVLDRPEFQPARSPTDPLGEFLGWVWSSITEFVGGLWSTVLGWIGTVLSPLGITIPNVDLHLPAVAAGLLLVGGLIFWVVRSLRRTIAPEVFQLQSEEAMFRTSPSALRAEAMELAQKGEFRTAVRVLYLAVLLQWDERGKFLFDRALTNREVLERLRAGEDAVSVQQLSPLVERFDRFWYGAVPCSPEEYADFSRLAAAAWESR
jgi:hypothetical protein